jgi:hypothetical protein
VNDRARSLVATMKSALDSVPGATGVGIYVVPAIVLVQIHVPTDERLLEVAGDLEMEIPRVMQSGRKKWWRYASLTHGDIKITASGPIRKGPRP